MEDPTKHLLEQIVVMLCYLTEVPQLSKTELLNRAAFCGIYLGVAKESVVQAGRAESCGACGAIRLLKAWCGACQGHANPPDA